jgi:IS30 family transposase
MFLSLLMTILVTFGFSSWKARMKCLSTFQSLALRLNNEHPNYLKAICSDNGTEFRNASFNQFCLQHGIDQHFFASRVPQQNGVME